MKTLELLQIQMPKIQELAELHSGGGGGGVGGGRAWPTPRSASGASSPAPPPHAAGMEDEVISWDTLVSR